MSDKTPSDSTSKAVSPNHIPHPTPEVVHKQTARLTTAEKLLKVNPQPMKRVPKRSRRLPSPDSTTSEEPTEDDPEDEDGYDFAPKPVTRKVKHESEEESEDESDDDSGDDSEEEYQQRGPDDSDEDELGDQDRRSPDCIDRYSSHHSSCERDDIATGDGDDSNF